MRIALLLVAGQNPLLIDDLIWVFSLSGDILGCDIDLVDGYMVHNLNVNVDLFFRLSCEAFRILTMLGFPLNVSGD